MKRCSICGQKYPPEEMATEDVCMYCIGCAYSDMNVNLIPFEEF